MRKDWMTIAGIAAVVLTLGLLVPCQGATNTWNGTTWSDGTPTSDDDIVVEGDLNWTSSMVSSVNSWEQTSGTVTFETTFSGGGFDTFTIDNDATVTGGTWTHLDNGSSESYRLSVDVGANFSLGAGATITGKGRGYNAFQGPGGATGGGYEEGGTYGGMGGGSDAVPYGSVAQPVNLGSGGDSDSGGGAVHLTVGGATTLDGEINVDSADNGNSGHGAGGSIYLETGTATGSGVLSSNCGNSGWSSRGRGAGGRIAVKLTQAGSDFTSFTPTYYCATASGGGRDSAGTLGGAGTIYLEDGSGQAEVIADNRGFAGDFTSAGTTAFTYGPNVSVTTRNGGKLMIEDDDTIDFGTANLQSDWKIHIAGDANVTVPANWTIADAHLMPDAMTTMNSNITVNSGGLITPHAREAAMTLQVNGLTVNDDGAVHADSLGAKGGTGYTDTGHRDGASHGGQGGDTGYSSGDPDDDSQGPCYGSFLEPTEVGSGTVNGPGLGGGAIDLTVVGALAVNGSGRISADGADDNESTGSGGSVKIHANSISGDGTISADGGDHGKYGGGGGGGRVAVVLGSGDFSSFSGAIQAFSDEYNAEDGAGGTVYLETPADGADGGTVYIDFNNVTTSQYVELPPTSGAFDDDLSNVAFELLNRGAVGMHGNETIRGLTMASDTTWHGNGYTLTVGSGGFSDDGGTIDLDNGGLTLDLLEDAAMDSATLTGDGTFTKAGDATLTLNMDCSGIDTAAEGGILRIGESGIVGSTAVGDGGTLQGTGSVEGLLQVGNGGTLAPGASAGVLTTGQADLLDGSTFLVEIGGTEAGEFDQLIVSDSGETFIGDGAVLQIAELNGFDPVKGTLADPSGGDTFEILDYEGDLDGAGIFDSLPDGAIVWSSGGQRYVIDYEGGDGSSIILTAVPEPGSLVLLAMVGALAATRRRRF